MNKPLYLFVGRSASGKTTVANLFGHIGDYPQVQSYTTRSKRHENEAGHTFVTDEEFDQLEDIIAYTEYNGFRYCATKSQLDDASIYVVDIPGVETLLEKYNSSRPIVVVYFDASIRTRIDRMIDRHDCDSAIISRLYNDAEFDWKQELSKLVWHHKNNLERDVEMCIVDADQSIDKVLGQTMNYFEQNSEEK